MSGFYNRRFARTGGYNVQGYSANADYRARQQAPVSFNFGNPKWVAFREVQPVRAAWVEAKAASFDFAASMFAAVVRFGDLTEKQGATVDRLAAQDAQRASQRAVSAPQAPAATFPVIQSTFTALAAAGGRKPVTIGDITLSLAPATGQNPGCVYVKVEGQYAGKITAQGVFRGVSTTPADTVAKLVEIEADPRGAVQAHAARVAAALAAAAAEGRPLSMPCGCCGLTLTDPVSIARGIGPICQARWGF